MAKLPEVVTLSFCDNATGREGCIAFITDYFNSKWQRQRYRIVLQTTTKDGRRTYVVTKYRYTRKG